MVLNVAQQLTGRVAKITLAGELDAGTAPLFQAELEKAVAEKPTRLVLLARDLSFMASAGVRMLIFAKQKMAPGAELYVIAPQQQVVDTLKRTGLIHSVIIQDEYQDA
jgi:anti-anti-sigma factor